MNDISGYNILVNLKPEQVDQVYDGRVGRCACGCSGTYWGEDALDHTPEENERMVALILKRVQRRATKAEAGEVPEINTHVYTDRSRMFSYDTASRLITVYTKPLKEVTR